MSRSTNTSASTKASNQAMANSPFEQNRPSVFTELNDRDRFAAMESTQNKRGPPDISTKSAVTPNSLDTEDNGGEWLLIGKNGRITASNRHQKQVLPNDIGIPCAQPRLPEGDTAVHWQVEISFIPTNSQVISVPKTITAFLNHLQAVNSDTAIAPVHYKDATGDEYLVKPADVPLNEQELAMYLVKYDNTRSGRIGLSVIVASTMTFNRFKQNKPLVQWFQTERISVLLDMIDVITPRQAGFFIRLLPKAESIDYHHLRISSNVPEAPTFQLVSRTLKTKNPKGGKDRSTTVLYAIVDSEDCDALVYWLRIMCDNVAGYEFYPLEEFLCLDHSAKVSLINRQIDFASKYASITASGFNFETTNFKMWMPHSSGHTSGTAIAVDSDDNPEVNHDTTNTANSPTTEATNLIIPPTQPDNPTSMVVQVGLLTQDAPPDIWDEDMSEVNGDATAETIHFCDDSVTKFTPPLLVFTAEEVVNNLNTALVLTGQQPLPSDNDTISTGTVEPPISNKRLRTTNGSVATGVRPSINKARSSPDDLSHLSITQFLYTVKSGDNTPLFAFVYEPVDGQRELLTTKYQEAARFIHVIHPYLVRRMNTAARAIMYPNMENEVTTALRQPDWQPFRIFSQIEPIQDPSRRIDNRLGTTLSHTQYQFQAHRTTSHSGRGGGRTNLQTYVHTPTQNHWSRTSHIQHAMGMTPSTNQVADHASFPGFSPAHLSLQERANSDRPTGDAHENPTVVAKANNGTHIDSSIICTGATTTYTQPDTALAKLQVQLENMQVKQQSLETSIAESQKSAQLQLNKSLQDLEQRQAENTQANNAVLQAELTKNKQEVTQELSATMQYLKMLHDNTIAAKQQTDAFQSTVLQKLDIRDQATNQTQQELQQHGEILARSTQPKHQTPLVNKENSTNRRLHMELNPVGTPTPRIGTLHKRQQQQSILATMSRIGPPKEQGEDTDMSRPVTSHGTDGKIHHPDNGTLGSAQGT